MSESKTPAGDDALLSALAATDADDGAIPDPLETGYIAGTLSPAEDRAFEESYADEPGYLAHLKSVRAKVAQLNTPGNMEALEERLRRERAECMSEAETAPASAFWGHASEEEYEECLAPLPMLGAERLRRRQIVPGPKGLEHLRIVLTVDELEEGDFAFSAEAEPALAGRVLRFGASDLVLRLRLDERRDLAYAMVFLSEAQFVAYTEQSHAPHWEE